MYYIQYQLRGSDEHIALSYVEAFWITDGKLVISMSGGLKYSFMLSELKYVNFDEMVYLKEN